ncbi:MAG: hypothetical protein ACT4OZ_12675 [Gemmatimonadota bacterium]
MTSRTSAFLFRLVTIATCMVTLASCRSRSQDQVDIQTADSLTGAPTAADSNPAPAQRLRIDTIVPNAIPFGSRPSTEIAIRGSGFHPKGMGLHTIAIGPMVINGVPANEAGTEILVVIPDKFVTGGGPPRPLFVGDHAVVVTAGDVSSNAVVLRVFP